MIRDLLNEGVLVIAAGGGGIPVVRTPAGLKGVEAVIDKDRASALLARGSASTVRDLDRHRPRLPGLPQADAAPLGARHGRGDGDAHRGRAVSARQHGTEGRVGAAVPASAAGGKSSSRRTTICATPSRDAGTHIVHANRAGAIQTGTGVPVAR